MRIHDASPQRAYRIELRRSPIEPPAETLDNPAAIARFCADLATYDRERLVRLDITTAVSSSASKRWRSALWTPSW